MVRLSDFDYNLPDDLIAQTPLTDRAASRLLHLNPATGDVQHRMFREVVNILRAGDVLVLNNTRVNAWRFRGKKATGAEVEILCLKEIEPGVFESLIKPAKRLKPGAVFELGLGVTGTVLEGGDDPIRIVKLSSADGELNSKLGQIGEMPLPPYITEKLDDSERYQTVFSEFNGSAAAPTAGLHFTDEILEELKAKGVKIATVTLHVGIDTFRPIQVDDVTEHQMHGEVCEISPDAANTINLALGERTSGTNQRSSRTQFLLNKDEVSNANMTDPGGENFGEVERTSGVNSAKPTSYRSPNATNFDKTDPGGVTDGSQAVSNSLSPSENGLETPGKVITDSSPRSLSQNVRKNGPRRATPPKATLDQSDRQTANSPLETPNSPLQTSDSRLQTPRIIAVGTTAVRTLETFATAKGHVEPGRKISRLFITPGYDFQIVNGMFTNFHFPRTTMLLMISALASREQILNAYQQAVEEKYRFLSFGDSMLLLKS